MGVAQTTDPTSPRVWIAIWLALIKPYLLLMLMYMSLLLLNYFELSFLTKGQVYGSRLSHILDIPSIPFFPI